MADVTINKFRASVVRDGSKPSSPGFIVSEGQDPVDPAGTGQNHLPVTIATAATGLAITDSQVLGGAGSVGQYIRGDGSLADFPESSGGGSSISYYLNGSVNQGTIGGVAYKELNKVPILGAGTDFTINADGYIASFITDAGDPNLLEIPGGNWNFETYFSASSGGGSPTFYVELYKVNSGGTATLIASNSTFPELIAFGTNIISYFSTLAVPTTALALTDRLAIRYYVTHSGRTITLHTEDNHLCQIITTFTTGLTALNGLTAQIQNFAVGTSGTDFAISSATATHTFNLPTASATNRGALSSADWTTFNNKTSNLGTVTSVGLSSATSGVTIGSSPVTTSGTITLAIATASGSQNGLLSSTDWTTFNSKQNALTNPVTGTGTTNYLPKFTGSTTIGNSIMQDTGTRIDIAGVLRLTPSSTTDIQAYTGSAYSNLFYDAASHNWQTSGGTAKMTLTAGGNLLVGTTTDNGARLQVNGSASIGGTNTYNGWIIGSHTNNVGSALYNKGNAAQTMYADSANTILNAETTLFLRTGNADRLTIASTGAATFSNTVAITNDLTINAALNPLVFLNTTSSLKATGIVTTESGTFKWGFGSNFGAGDNSWNVYNYTAGSRYLTINSVGHVFIGCQSDPNASVNGIALYPEGEIDISRSSGTTCVFNRNTTNGQIVDFRYNNTQVGSISTNSNSLPSDLNFKKNITDISIGLNLVTKLRPVHYRHKMDKDYEALSNGIIAQELEQALLDCGIEKNSLLMLQHKPNEKEGESQYWVDYTKMIPVLIKSIQELKQEIDTLKN